MFEDNIQVNKRPQPRPESEDLDYPTQPHYEPRLSDETTAEKGKENSATRKDEQTSKTHAKKLRTKALK